MRWLVRPSDPRCVEEAVVGGKGASLARLHRLGVSVPPFLVIPTSAHRQMAAASPSEELIAELRDALAELDGGEGISVRSSAIGEDAAESSFAGLYHTSLEVEGCDAVVRAVQQCWRSYDSGFAAEYRDHRTVPGGGAMAVVLQRMIMGEWSGVCFTAHPVTLALSEGLINSVGGLGEALVSGEKNPEEITVAVRDGTVLARGGERTTPLPDAVLAAVWKTSTDIAKSFEFPQDVEWSWAAGVLHVLQSRPITTLADVFYSRSLEPWKNDPAAHPDDPERIWSRMLADETWVSPISPLFYNVHNSTPGRVQFLRSHGDRTKLPPDLFKYHRATAYADVNLIRRMYEYQPPIARIRGILNFLPEGMQQSFSRAPWRWAGRMRRILSYEMHDRRMRSLFNNYRYVAAQWSDYVAKSNRWLDLDLDALTLPELQAHQAAVQREMAAVGPPCAIAVLSHASDLHLLLTGLLNRWCRGDHTDGENLYARLSSGLDDSETLRENQSLWEIGRRIRELGPKITALAASSDWATFKMTLQTRPGGSELVAAFETFWREHRHLGSSYKDLIWPRWGDDIDLCFAMLKGHINSIAEAPSQIYARSAAARREAHREILASLRGPLAPWRRSILRWLLRYNELYMAVRDNHRFYIDRNWYEVRRIYRSYGARLATSGVLSARDDVFFLGVDEVHAGLLHNLSAAAVRRVQVRKQVWSTTLRQQGPKFLKGWEPFEDSLRTKSFGEERELHGIAASPGSAVGAARIVYDVSALGTVKDGEILVTRQTDPSWTTVFGRIAGLVLETGGVLSHGTSLCREYGLPCVTAVERATMRIPDGCMIQLMGSAGTVLLLDELRHATNEKNLAHAKLELRAGFSDESWIRRVLAKIKGSSV
jgi:phosphohistidine swiveling domain-containing protein